MRQHLRCVHLAPLALGLRSKFVEPGNYFFVGKFVK